MMTRTPPCLTIRYEDVLDNPRSATLQMGDALGMEPLLVEPVLAPELTGVAAARRARLSAIRPASSAIILPGSVRRKRRFEWTPKRLAILRVVAGDMIDHHKYVDHNRKSQIRC